MGRARVEEAVDDVALAKTREVLIRIGKSESAIVTAERAGTVLLLAASQGMFAATALLQGTAYDKVGRDLTEGAVDFVEGGQSVELPRRHVLTFAEAAEVLDEFIGSGIVDVSRGWEQQQ